jgi:putative two-component system response regulator
MVDLLCSAHRFNERELENVRMHPTAGYSILGDIQSPWPIAQMIIQHHERLDGSGYPRGLKGEEVLLEARVIGVADVVEAMSSDRPHRAAPGIQAAIEEIQSNRGKLYDPAVVDSCVRVLEKSKLAFWNE